MQRRRLDLVDFAKGVGYSVLHSTSSKYTVSSWAHCFGNDSVAIGIDHLYANIHSKGNVITNRFSAVKPKNNNVSNVCMRLCKVIQNHLATELVHERRICVSFQIFHFGSLADH